MSSTNVRPRPPAIQLAGQIDHPDFRDAIALLRATARVETADGSPEVIVVAQSRPGETCQREIEMLQRRWPLAGIVALLGSWCEGETRTGRPWPGITRLYWYEFPAWWRQQLKLHATGLCPDWARPARETFRAPTIRNPKSEIRNRRGGAVVLSTAYRDIADALASTFYRASYATVWQPPWGPKLVVRGAIAGVWDGGQLDEREASNLAAFCRQLARDAAPVLVLLDFPRRNGCDLARTLGASAVLGKPWLNADLIATIDEIANRNEDSHATDCNRAA